MYWTGWHTGSRPESWVLCPVCLVNFIDPDNHLVKGDSRAKVKGIVDVLEEPYRMAGSMATETSATKETAAQLPNASGYGYYIDSWLFVDIDIGGPVDHLMPHAPDSAWLILIDWNSHESWWHDNDDLDRVRDVLLLNLLIDWFHRKTMRRKELCLVMKSSQQQQQQQINYESHSSPMSPVA